MVKICLPLGPVGPKGWVWCKKLRLRNLYFCPLKEVKTSCPLATSFPLLLLSLLSCLFPSLSFPMPVPLCLFPSISPPMHLPFVSSPQSLLSVSSSLSVPLYRFPSVSQMSLLLCLSSMSLPLFLLPSVSFLPSLLCPPPMPLPLYLFPSVSSSLSLSLPLSYVSSYVSPLCLFPLSWIKTMNEKW